MTRMHRRTFLVAALLTACTRSREGAASSAGMPWPADRVVRAKDFASELATANPKPTIVHVGPNVLFKRGHVPGAVHGGEAGDPAGLQAIADLLAPLPRTSDLVLYCGCCPYEHCQNIRPAYAKAVELGFQRVRVIDLPTSLKVDWTDQGLALET